MDSPASLTSIVWLLVGWTRNVPGVLQLDRGRLRYVIEDGHVFDADLADVTNVRFPWYYFGGGMKLNVEGEEYRFSFIRPNGAEDVSDELRARLGSSSGLLAAGQNLIDFGRRRQAGQAWRAALAARPANESTTAAG